MVVDRSCDIFYTWRKRFDVELPRSPAKETETLKAEHLDNVAHKRNSVSIQVRTLQCKPLLDATRSHMMMMRDLCFESHNFLSECVLATAPI